MTNWMAKALTLLAAAGVSAWLIADDNVRERDDRSKILPAVTNAKWQQECGSCHLAFHPGLLPERSWRAMMGGLDKHFGENAGLDPATQQEITDFLVGHSADRSANRRSARITRSLSPTAVPRRISETPYFVGKHDDIRADVWQRKSVASKANCAACHGGAERGDFSEHRVRIPK